MAKEKGASRMIATETPLSGLDSDQDIDATLDRGVAVLRASGRLEFEDDEFEDVSLS